MRPPSRAGDVALGKDLEIVGVLVREDLGLGVDAVRKSVERRNGLAAQGAGSGGLERIAAVGFELLLGNHVMSLD